MLAHTAGVGPAIWSPPEGGCPIGADVMVVVMVVSYQEKWDKWVSLSFWGDGFPTQQGLSGQVSPRLWESVWFAISVHATWWIFKGLWVRCEGHLKSTGRHIYIYIYIFKNTLFIVAPVPGPLLELAREVSL